MESILEKICWGQFCAFHKPVPSRPTARDAPEKIWAEAEQRLGRDAADQLRDKFSDMLCEDGCEDFRAGFRLGVALMLEFLRE